MTIQMLASEIARWHDGTFDACGTDLVLAKLNEEFGEFWDDPSDEEAADVIICLFAWSFRSKGSLPEILVSKWNEVKARTDQRERDTARGIR